MLTRAGIVGRPNVGKSTFFNCLLGRSRAIVGDFAGVTRDYKEEILDLKNFQIQLVDTAGLKSSPITEQDKMINKHLSSRENDDAYSHISKKNKYNNKN